MGLVARHLEAAGIPTVVVGSAIDIVEHCGTPRFVFTDFPLGNPCGRPYDADLQRSIVAAGLDLLESAVAPRAVRRMPYQWSEDESWRARYMEVRAEDAAALAAKGEERRALRADVRHRSRVSGSV